MDTTTPDIPVATNTISVQENIPRREPLGGAYAWLLLFMVIYCARPEDWIPGLAIVPLAKIAGIFALIALLSAIKRVRQRPPREVIYLVLLLTQACLGVPFSPVYRGGAFQTTLDFAKVVPIVIVIALTVGSLRRLRGLLLIQSASVAIIAVVAVWKGHTWGGRLADVLQGNYSNPNDLAFSVVLTLPLCLAFLFTARNRIIKLMWIMAMMVMVYVVFLSASRAGLLSLIVATAVCVWEFAVRGRRRYLLPVIAVTGILFWVYASGGLQTRLNSTFQSAAQGEDEAYGSSQQRKELLIRSLKVTAEHPVFGIGLGNFPIISGSWLVTHNSYTQMSSEAGVPAFVLYILILWRGFRNLIVVKRLARARSKTALWAGALLASLSAFVVGSFFASEAYQFFTYFLVAYTTTLYQIAVREWTVNHSRKTAETEASGSETISGGFGPSEDIVRILGKPVFQETASLTP